MSKKIIGHGTWYDKIAYRIIRREKRLQRNLHTLRTESGIGASGIPHVGSFADAARSHTVSIAIENQGSTSELIAFSDDKDGLRKIPIGFPSQLKKYLGYPVTSIPDPFNNCHKSFGEHMSSLLLEALDKCGIQYQFMSGSDVYQRGLLNNQIELLLKNADRVGEIVREEVGQDKYREVLPYFPICNNCGRIYTTKAYEFLTEENKILYICEGMTIGERWLQGCGYKGEVDYRRGEGKLSWKAGEFAARWAALGICFEAYGKDIADSVRVNDRICKEILNFDPPLHVQYEMFLDTGGKKISKSVGNVFTPQLWFRYGSPQSLLLLTLKRFTGTRTLSIRDIPRYMDEFDELEDVFFGKKKLTNIKDQAKLIGLYLYCWGLKPPEKLGTHISYDLLIHLAKIAPKDSALEFIKEKLRTYNYAITSQNLETRINYALNWIDDFEDIENEKIILEDAETAAVLDYIKLLKKETDANVIQEAVFETARKHGIKPRRFFEILYTAVLGVSKGPKLGPYIVDIGTKKVAELLKKIV